LRFLGFEVFGLGLNEWEEVLERMGLELQCSWPPVPKPLTTVWIYDAWVCSVLVEAYTNPCKYI
jgi:hypothetical protein